MLLGFLSPKTSFLFTKNFLDFFSNALLGLKRTELALNIHHLVYIASMRVLVIVFLAACLAAVSCTAKTDPVMVRID